MTMTLPQVLSFLGNLFKLAGLFDKLPTLSMNDWLRQEAPPSSAAPPQQPAPVANFNRATVPAAPEAPPMDAAPEPPPKMPETQQPAPASTPAQSHPPIPPGYDSLRPPPGWQPQPWLEHYNREKYGIEPGETRREEPKRQAPEPKLPTQKQLDQQADRRKAIEALQARPLREMVLDFHEEYIAVHPAHIRENDKDFVRIFIGELEALVLQHPVALLYLQPAFVDAFKGGGKAIGSVKNNLYRELYKKEGIACPASWAPKKDRGRVA